MSQMRDRRRWNEMWEAVAEAIEQRFTVPARVSSSPEYEVRIDKDEARIVIAHRTTHTHLTLVDTSADQLTKK